LYIFVRHIFRFARFVEGDSHLSDEEVHEYDYGMPPNPYHDEEDEDEIDFRLSSL
jgi:hypothetical protein